MEEASKYHVVPNSSSSLGLQESSSSSSLWGHAEAVGVSEGFAYGAEGELGRFPLSVVRNRAASAFRGWSEPSWDSVDAERVNGLALVPVGRTLRVLLRKGVSVTWKKEDVIKGGVQAVLRCSVAAWVCRRKASKRKFCTS